MKIGGLFFGYGGLDMAVQSILGGELAWVSEIDRGACEIIEHRYPGVPNIGDITAVDWSQVEPVDVITGGSPCQDLSHAGRRAGMTEGTRSNLWVAMREAIAQLRPSLVVWENVRGAASAEASSDLEFCPGCMGDPEHGGPPLRALGRVVGDLADLGYVGQIRGLRAADVGSCHGRFRYFLAASNADDAGRCEQWRAESVRPQHSAAEYAGALLPTPRAGDGEKGGPNQRGSSGDLMLPSAVTLLPTPSVADMQGGRKARSGDRSDELLLNGIAAEERWGQYAQAIHRWETLTRPAPPPTELGPKGNPRLSAAFSEWMMGLPAGWVTDVPGITRNEALKALGNGVVPQQAAAALRDMLAWEVAA